MKLNYNFTLDNYHLGFLHKLTSITNLKLFDANGKNFQKEFFENIELRP